MTLPRPADEPSPTTPRAAPPSRRAPPQPDRARAGLSPRHWKVRSKLAAVLLVPAIAFLVLASINMAGQIGSAREFGRGANVAEFGRQASARWCTSCRPSGTSPPATSPPAGRPSNQAQIDRDQSRGATANAKLREGPSKAAAGARRPN